MIRPVFFKLKQLKLTNSIFYLAAERIDVLDVPDKKQRTINHFLTKTLKQFSTNFLFISFFHFNDSLIFYLKLYSIYGFGFSHLNENNKRLKPTFQFLLHKSRREFYLIRAAARKIV